MTPRAFRLSVNRAARLLFGGSQGMSGRIVDVSKSGARVYIWGSSWVPHAFELLEEEGTPAVFDRYSNSFLRIYFPIPEGRENEIARKVLIKHLTSGNSYGIRLKEVHAKFPQPELGPWVEGSRTVGAEWKPSVLEGWEPPEH